jgi:hypothetical protein
VKTISYIALFTLIQLVSLVLTVLGFFVIGFLAYFYAWQLVAGKFQWRGGLWTWLWGNEEDGIVGPGMGLNRWNSYYWSALRNPCNNLRFVRGVSGIGRPLLYRTWTMFGKQFYLKWGWMSDGYPAFSAGAGKGF